MSDRAAGSPRGHRFRLIPSDGDDDAEHPDATVAVGAPHIQASIMKKIGHGLRNALRQGFHDEGSRRAVRRLDEVSSPDVDHTWPWHLSKHHGPLLSHSEYVGAVRVRLGAAGPDEPAPCELCRMLMDSCGSQPACCSIAEETRGHYKVAAQIHASAAQVDSSAELEAEGLIPRTARRPADICTVALGCRLSALGIGMCSPDAQQAGNDCTATVAARKRDTYVPYMATLERQNIQYEPLIRSSYGRPRPRATLALRTLSSRIAGRRGTATSNEIYKRLRGAVSTGT